MTTASKRCVIAVLGTGSIGHRHCREFAALEGVGVIAVPARPERAEQLRAAGFDAVPTLDDAVARGARGVVIATDTGRHVSDALRAIEGGCHVLVEKPLATTRADGERIVEAAAKKRVSAHVACCLRFDPALRWLHARLPSLGSLRLADAECLSWLPGWRGGRDHRAGYAGRPSEGGVLLDLIHEIDLLSWMLGPPTGVSSRLENAGVLGFAPSIEETAALLLRHPREICASLRLSYVIRPESRRLRVWGENGMLEWDRMAMRSRFVDVDGGEKEEFHYAAPSAMYHAQARAWIDFLSATERGDNDLVPAETGAAVVGVCDAARIAMARGAWVNIP